MNTEAKDYWGRALKTLETARMLVSSDPDSATSRAYYSAFYAVSALFAISGRTFTKHSGLETALHRDLIKTGKWDKQLGELYSSLREIRQVGDYGGGSHVSQEDSSEAITAATLVLEAVKNSHPDIFCD